MGGNKKVLIIVLSVLVMVLIILNVFIINMAFQEQKENANMKQERLIYVPNKLEGSS